MNLILSCKQAPWIVKYPCGPLLLSYGGRPLGTDTGARGPGYQLASNRLQGQDRRDPGGRNAALGTGTDVMTGHTDADGDSGVQIVVDRAATAAAQSLRVRR